MSYNRNYKVFLADDVDGTRQSQVGLMPNGWRPNGDPELLLNACVEDRVVAVWYACMLGGMRARVVGTARVCARRVPSGVAGHLGADVGRVLRVVGADHHDRGAGGGARPATGVGRRRGGGAAVGVWDNLVYVCLAPRTNCTCSMASYWHLDETCRGDVNQGL